MPHISIEIRKTDLARDHDKRYTVRSARHLLMRLRLHMWCRQGWKALLSEQGFEAVIALGEACAAPALLQRQTVVLGVSNGNVLVRRPAFKQAQLRNTMRSLTSEAIQQMKDIPLRNSMAPGVHLCNLA